MSRSLTLSSMSANTLISLRKNVAETLVSDLARFSVGNHSIPKKMTTFLTVALVTTLPMSRRK